MRELQARIQDMVNEAKGYTEGESKDLEKAQECLDKVDELQKEYDIEARIVKMGKASAEDAEPVGQKNVDGFNMMVKMATKQKLTEDEKAALVSGEDAAGGENYLIPEDVRAEINELRKTYISAKSLVTVETTTSLSGSVNYEDGVPTGLTNFDDGDAIAEEDGIKFVQKKFNIAHYGKIIPVSRILAGAEKSGLMGYIDRFFVRNAILSENAAIFADLKAGYNAGTAKAVAGWKAFKKSINKDLDPSCLLNGVIITNQSGFAALDEEEDNDGRPVLHANPAHPTEKMFQGLPIHVFPDAQLPNIDATHFPMIYGDTKAGLTFVEHKALEFALSEHANFNKNQNTLRVIEGFDTMSTDTSAYIYGSFAATAQA
jgi:HK97 family phage major capsid protein